MGMCNQDVHLHVISIPLSLEQASLAELCTPSAAQIVVATVFMVSFMGFLSLEVPYCKQWKAGQGQFFHCIPG